MHTARARVDRLEQEIRTQHDRVDIAAILAQRFERIRAVGPAPPPPSEAEFEERRRRLWSLARENGWGGFGR